MPRKRTTSTDVELHDPEMFGDAGHHDEGGSVEYTHGGADDALGLYLKQMGAIPLLSREKELALAIRLETARTRYRHAVLFSWWTIRRVVDVFEHVQAGEMPIDPQIDTVQSLGLSREAILGPSAAQRQDAQAPAPGRRPRFRHLPAHPHRSRPDPRPPHALAQHAQGGSAHRGTVPAHRIARRPGRRDGPCRPPHGRHRPSGQRDRPLAGAARAAHRAASRSCATAPSRCSARWTSWSGCSPSSAAASKAFQHARRELAEGNLRLVVADRQELSRPRSDVRRSDSGRQSRPDAGGGQVRAPPRLQVRHLRHLVDSPGHPARARRQRPHRPRAVPSGRHPGGHRAGPRRTARRSRIASRRSRRSPRCSAPARRRRDRCGRSPASRSACTSRWATRPSGR